MPASLFSISRGIGLNPRYRDRAELAFEHENGHPAEQTFVQEAIQQFAQVSFVCRDTDAQDYTHQVIGSYEGGVMWSEISAPLRPFSWD